MLSLKGKLILEDGASYTGELLNNINATGEVVFNTSMVGYQESLTDPSYCRQILTLTYPIVGNYGVADIFMQSRKCFVGGFVIGELCEKGSNWHYENSLADFLTKQGVPCLYNVDTRAVTRHIRAAGTMKGIIVPDDTSQTEMDELMARPIKKEVVMEVTTPKPYDIDVEGETGKKPYHVVALDYGVKYNILKSMHDMGIKLTVVPADTSAEDVLALQPDGIFLSNGPGDPADVPEQIEVVKTLVEEGTRQRGIPMFGICLGHQLLCRALGADTYKLKFGHRGCNQPVKRLADGRVHISSQNHGFAVDEKSLSGLPIEVTHINVNDGTVEGIRHTELPIFSVQYHPEAAPGPNDNMYLFDEFMSLMEKKGE